MGYLVGWPKVELFASEFSAAALAAESRLRKPNLLVWSGEKSAAKLEQKTPI